MKARLIVSMNCSRDCSYCCNKHPNTQPIDIALEQYIKQILPIAESTTVTGGEPCELTGTNLYQITNQISCNTKKPVYLYTQKFNDKFKSVMSMIDGFTYTLHYPLKEGDMDMYIELQKYIKDKVMSKRLVINQDINDYILVDPSAWSNVKVIPFIQDGNCPLPQGEVLFRLK